MWSLVLSLVLCQWANGWRKKNRSPALTCSACLLGSKAAKELLNLLILVHSNPNQITKCCHLMNIFIKNSFTNSNFNVNRKRLFTTWLHRESHLMNPLLFVKFCLLQSKSNSVYVLFVQSANCGANDSLNGVLKSLTFSKWTNRD